MLFDIIVKLEVILTKKKMGEMISQGIGKVGKKGLDPGSGGLISFDCAGLDLRSIQLLPLKSLEAYEFRQVGRCCVKPRGL